MLVSDSAFVLGRRSAWDNATVLDGFTHAGGSGGISEAELPGGVGDLRGERGERSALDAARADDG